MLNARIQRPLCKGGRIPGSVIGASFWRAAFAVFATAALVELTAISSARADCDPGGLGAYADTTTDFDGTIQSKSACGAFSAIPGISSERSDQWRVGEQQRRGCRRPWDSPFARGASTIARRRSQRLRHSEL